MWAFYDRDIFDILAIGHGGVFNINQRVPSGHEDESRTTASRGAISDDQLDVPGLSGFLLAGGGNAWNCPARRRRGKPVAPRDSGPDSYLRRPSAYETAALPSVTIEGAHRCDRLGRWKRPA